jgi:phospholipase/carboxylesterase
MSQVETVEIETGPRPTGTVLWLHGLGADGHDFEPIVPELVERGDRALRFIFPHAPIRKVTINNSMPMRAWYDIVGFDRNATQDERGIRATDAIVRELIQRENERGIPTSRIVLAGFSQGGAVTLYSGIRYPETLAGMMALSCYMLMASKLEAERSDANNNTPIFMAHGKYDPVVDFHHGEDSRKFLQAAGYEVEWRPYQMPHSVCPEEIADIAKWLRRVL